MNRLRLALLFAALPLGGTGPLAVVVNPQCAVRALTHEQAANIFLGRDRQLPSGGKAIPVEQILPEDLRSQFYLRLTRMHLAAVRSHWARLYFTGQGQPPRQVDNGAAVTAFVLAHPNAVGFLEQSQVTDQVRVVLILE